MRSSIVKASRRDTHRQARAIPALQFEDQSLTSFAGLVVFQQFFANIRLAARFADCFGHFKSKKVFGLQKVFLQLVVHLILGFRELRDSRHYESDPLVKRILGLNTLPDVATISRTLTDADEKSVLRLRSLLREMATERIKGSGLVRITLDFDGSVLSTGRYAEGTAVGFNKKKKGARSYYPLFCMLAQTGQVFDFLHRPGNVHDSQGAKAFILACIQQVRAALPWGVVIEVRMDSAFFSDEIVRALEAAQVEFSISVPFERFVQLKQKVEQRKKWSPLGDEVSYFESHWKPKSWNRRCRFLFIRTLSKKQRKGPVQLDLFVPHEYGYEFKVIVTNKQVQARAVVVFHEGRGSQEGVFAELKTNCHLDYVPARRLIANQLYLLAGLFAHNLTRQLQMETTLPSRRTTPKRATLWVFQKLQTIRHTVIQRAGRLTRPQGTLTLTIGGDQTLKDRLLTLLTGLQADY
jgi:hypothetical protein